MSNYSAQTRDVNNWNYQLKPCPTPFGLFVRESRLEQELTGLQAEEKWGLATKTIKNYEARGVHPREDYVVSRLAAGCGVSEEELAAHVRHSKEWLRNCTDSEFTQFYNSQKLEINKSAPEYLNRLMPTWYQRRIYGNPNSGFNTFKGPTICVHSTIPHPVGIALQREAEKLGCTIPDIVRLAVENYINACEIPVNWEENEVNLKY